MAARSAPGNIDEYIAAFPPEVQEILQTIRRLAKAVAPEAEEKISYQIPAFALGSVFFFMAAFKHHIGLYPPVQGDEQLRDELAPFLGEKGNLKFPLDQPMPYDLIRRIIEAQLQAHLFRTAAKRNG